jgi:hypothetical protein
MCIFLSGIFTKACGSKLTPIRKCRLCFPGCMLSIPVTTVPQGIKCLLSSKKNERKNKTKCRKPVPKYSDSLP